jgi:hypothetical protein
MAEPAGAGDPHLEQAMLAQLPPVSYLSRWQRDNSAPPPSPAPVGTAAAVPPAPQAEAGEASPGTVPAQAGDSGAAAADGAVQAAGAERGARPKPVPPPRSGEQRKAALDAARQRNAELKALRAGLQARQLTLAELLALAQSDHTAGRMPVRTALMALPGIRTARASQLMIRAGIGDGCRAGALTAGQRTRLLAAVVAVDAELAARRDRHHHSGQ